MLIISALSLAIWVYLLGFRGQFWRADQVLPAAKQPSKWADVTVVIPARDEAETIGTVVGAHQMSKYPGSLDIVVANDSSTDGTAEIAENTEGPRPVEVLDVPPLTVGWSGKIWALHNAIEVISAREQTPCYVLFTDADIQVDETLFTKLVAVAERDGLALTSIMARLDNSGFWGRWLVPAFIFFFQKLYPFPLINDPASSVAGAAGGVVLIRWDALQAIGGMEAIREALIDDCTLAEKVKASAPGTRIGLYLSSAFGQATSLRDNQSYQAMEAMIARTAYAQLGYNPLALIGTLMGLGRVYLAPGAATLIGFAAGQGWLAITGALSWLIMAVAYKPTAKIYGEGIAFAVMLPFAAAVYGWFTWLSGWRHMRGRGNAWKGRNYTHS